MSAPYGPEVRQDAATRDGAVAYVMLQALNAPGPASTQQQTFRVHEHDALPGKCIV